MWGAVCIWHIPEQVTAQCHMLVALQLTRVCMNNTNVTQSCEHMFSRKEENIWLILKSILILQRKRMRQQTVRLKRDTNEKGKRKTSTGYPGAAGQGRSWAQDMPTPATAWYWACCHWESTHMLLEVNPWVPCTYFTMVLLNARQSTSDPGASPCYTVWQ